MSGIQLSISLGFPLPERNWSMISYGMTELAYFYDFELSK